MRRASLSHQHANSFNPFSADSSILNGCSLVCQRHAWDSHDWWRCPRDVPVGPLSSILMTRWSIIQKFRHASERRSFLSAMCLLSYTGSAFRNLTINSMSRSCIECLIGRIYHLINVKILVLGNLSFLMKCTLLLARHREVHVLLVFYFSP